MQERELDNALDLLKKMDQVIQSTWNIQLHHLGKINYEVIEINSNLKQLTSAEAIQLVQLRQSYSIRFILQELQKQQLPDQNQEQQHPALFHGLTQYGRLTKEEGIKLLRKLTVYSSAYLGPFWYITRPGLDHDHTERYWMMDVEEPGLFRLRTLMSESNLKICGYLSKPGRFLRYYLDVNTKPNFYSSGSGVVEENKCEALQCVHEPAPREDENPHEQEEYKQNFQQDYPFVGPESPLMEVHWLCSAKMFGFCVCPKSQNFIIRFYRELDLQ